MLLPFVLDTTTGFMQKADTKTTMLFFLGILLIVLVSVFFSKMQHSKNLKNVKGKEYKTFKAILSEKGFSQEEVEFLYKYYDIMPFTSPFLLISKKSNLESFINKILNQILSNQNYDAVETREKDKNLAYKILNRLDFIFSKTPPLSSTRSIPVGKKVRLYIKEYGYFYTEVILNVEGGIVVTKPKRDDIKNWKKPVTIYFFLEDDAGYSFNSFIEDEVSEDHLQGLFITHSDLLKRYQKRAYKRKEAQFYITYSFAYYQPARDGSTKKLKIDPTEYDRNIIDISAGGCSFESLKEGRANQLLKMSIYINRNTINSISKVIRVLKRGKKFVYHTKFLKIRPHDQNTIYEYIFKSKSRTV